MKQILSFIILISLNSAISAQNDSLFKGNNVRFEGQVGLNMTGFIKSFIVLNTTAIPAQQLRPADFNAKLLLGIKTLPKFLYGIRFGTSYQTNESGSADEGGNTSRTDKDQIRNYRIGLEVQRSLSKRISIYAGLDYIHNMSNQKTVTTFLGNSPTPPFNPIKITTTTEQKDKITGFGPVFGLQFHLHKNLLLGTEASLYKTDGKGGTQTRSDNPNSVPQINYTSSKSNSIVLPLFVNLNFVF